MASAPFVATATLSARSSPDRGSTILKTRPNEPFAINSAFANHVTSPYVNGIGTGCQPHWLMRSFRRRIVYVSVATCRTTSGRDADSATLPRRALTTSLRAGRSIRRQPHHPQGRLACGLLPAPSRSRARRTRRARPTRSMTRSPVMAPAAGRSEKAADGAAAPPGSTRARRSRTRSSRTRIAAATCHVSSSATSRHARKPHRHHRLRRARDRDHPGQRASRDATVADHPPAADSGAGEDLVETAAASRSHAAVIIDASLVDAHPDAAADLAAGKPGAVRAARAWPTYRSASSMMARIRRATASPSHATRQQSIADAIFGIPPQPLTVVKETPIGVLLDETAARLKIDSSKPTHDPSTARFERGDPTTVGESRDDATEIQAPSEAKARGGTVRAHAMLRRKRGVMGDVWYVFTALAGLRSAKKELASLEQQQQTRQVSRKRHLVTLGRTAVTADALDHPALGKSREALQVVEDERSKHAGAVAASDAELERTRRDREAKAKTFAAETTKDDAGARGLAKKLEPLEKEVAAVRKRGTVLKEQLRDAEDHRDRIAARLGQARRWTARASGRDRDAQGRSTLGPARRARDRRRARCARSADRRDQRRAHRGREESGRTAESRGRRSAPHDGALRGDRCEAQGRRACRRRGRGRGRRRAVRARRPPVRRPPGDPRRAAVADRPDRHSNSARAIAG